MMRGLCLACCCFAAPAFAQDSGDWVAMFKCDIGTCWNVGGLTDGAENVSVHVGFELTQDARPIAQSIELLGYDGGSEAAADIGFEVARRAILRCGNTGYGLPPELYDQWRHVELTFDPNHMARR